MRLVSITILLISFPVAADPCPWTLATIEPSVVATTDDKVRVTAATSRAGEKRTPPSFVIDPEKGSVTPTTDAALPSRDARAVLGAKPRLCRGTTCTDLLVDPMLGNLALAEVVPAPAGDLIVAVYGDSSAGSKHQLATFDASGKRLATWKPGKRCLAERPIAVVGATVVGLCGTRDDEIAGGSPLIVRAARTGRESSRIKGRFQAIAAATGARLVIYNYARFALEAYDLARPKKPSRTWRWAEKLQTPRIASTAAGIVVVETQPPSPGAVIDADKGSVIHRLSIPICN